MEESDFEELRTLAPCTGRYEKNMPVNEVSGYRIFGGCLNVYMDAYLEPNMMETSKQSGRTIEYHAHLKLYIEKEI